MNPLAAHRGSPGKSRETCQRAVRCCHFMCRSHFKIIRHERWNSLTFENANRQSNNTNHGTSCTAAEQRPNPRRKHHEDPMMAHTQVSTYKAAQEDPVVIPETDTGPAQLLWCGRCCQGFVVTASIVEVGTDAIHCNSYKPNELAV